MIHMANLCLVEVSDWLPHAEAPTLRSSSSCVAEASDGRGRLGCSQNRMVAVYTEKQIGRASSALWGLFRIS